jgi:hypothetical protein
MMKLKRSLTLGVASVTLVVASLLAPGAVTASTVGPTTIQQIPVPPRSFGGGTYVIGGVSTDGRYSVVEDGYGVYDYRFDRLNHRYSQFNVSSSGETSNLQLTDAAMSPDGSLVAFSTASSNLGGGVTSDISGVRVFLRDLVHNTTTLVSSSAARALANGDARNPIVSANDQYVLFQSAATNLLPSDAGRSPYEEHLYRKDIATGAVIEVPVPNGETNSFGWSISGNGNSIGYTVYTANTSEGYVYNVLAKTMTHLIVPVDPTTTPRYHTASVSLSADGTKAVSDVAQQESTSGGPNYPAGFATCAVATGQCGVSQPDGQSSVLSPNGSTVAYMAGDTLGNWQVYTKNLISSQVTLISASDSGQLGNGSSTSPEISGDGRTVAFNSASTNLVPNGTSGTNAYLRGPAPLTPAPATYVALGDSYSSGEGLPSYYSDSNSTPTFDTCHRSPHAYGPLIDAQKKLGPMIFKACSGAVTDDFFVANPANPSELAQLSDIPSSARTITLTIGGNDAGFTNVLAHCIRGLGSKIGGYQCSKSKVLSTGTHNRILALQGQNGGLLVGRPIHALSLVYEAIHKRAPAAKIYVGAYPQVFGASRAHYVRTLGAPSGYTCTVGQILEGAISYRVDYQDALWIDALGIRLNKAISDQVAVARAAGVPVSYVAPTQFKNHGLCDASPAWLRKLVVDESIPNIWKSTADVASFHPTAVGQSQGYERAFSQQIG